MWRNLFDHYVFGDAGPAAHIPEQRRGVLRPLTADNVEKLRERAEQSL